MGGFPRFMLATGLMSLPIGIAGVLAFTVPSNWNRDSKIYELHRTDPLLGTSIFARFNPHNKALMSCVCKRKIPIQEIMPELLAEDGKLVQSFCAGAFASRRPQRKYSNTNEASYAASLYHFPRLPKVPYSIGTVIGPDNEEVLAVSNDSIILRSAFEHEPWRRPVITDNLFEVTAEIKPEEGVAEFSIKTVVVPRMVQDMQGRHVDSTTAILPVLPSFGPVSDVPRMLMELGVKNCIT